MESNTCPICLTSGLSWHLHINKSQMHMFKCGHGTCKDCFTKLRNSEAEFSCPMCREEGVLHSVHFLDPNTKEWIIFAEWYNEFEIFIMAGTGKNIVKNSAFGKQLIRLIRETKKKRVPA